ncbi:MAG: cytochrome c biogenesis CcdA family protein [Solirubrobacteraceae bacterium]|nr:MAG: cytochrome C biogenesis protein [Solirubrobacterales bacterium]
MTLAVGHATIFTAFAAGFVSFVSPCVLPLVPGYLSSISGISIAELRAGERRMAALLVPSFIFCLSFTVVFVALGMTATGLGSTLRDHRHTLDIIAGTLVLALGIVFVLTPFVDRLNREWRPEALMRRAGSGGPVVAGAAFAVAWTPCLGPILGAILTFAARSDSVAKGGALLAVYSLGLAIPFVLCALAFDRATGAFRWLRDHYLAITAVSGAVLVVLGALMLTENFTWLNSQVTNVQNALGLQVLGQGL